MPSKALMGWWIFFDVCLLAAGVLAVIESIMLKMPNMLNHFVFSDAHTTGGLVLGIFFLITFIFSVGAIVQKNHVTIGLVVLNWLLLADAIVVLVVGTMIWFFTLKERRNFFNIYQAQPDANKIAIQNHFQCCGYFNANDIVVTGSGFCANATFVQQTNNATGNFCVSKITKFADVRLNDAFSTIYGFMAICIGLFLASLCVIKKREEEERFKKIDAKRGGRGFV